MGDAFPWRPQVSRNASDPHDGGQASLPRKVPNYATMPTADDGAPPAELYPADIPVPPALLYRVGLNAIRQAVDAGGCYDDKIVAIAVYDRPWAAAGDPGPANVLGTIYFSCRTDRVYRIEVNPAAGGTYERMLDELEHLTGLLPEALPAEREPDSSPWH